MWNRKRIYSTAIVAVVAMAMLLIGAYAARAERDYVTGKSYGRQTTSVTSSTTPVSVMPFKIRGTWQLCADSGCTVSLLCADYTGTLPASMPADYIEVPAGQCRADGKDTESTLSLAQMCVLKTGSSACNAYAVWR